MKWDQAFSAAQQPALPQIADYVATPLWAELLEHLADHYGAAPSVEYSSCSARPGWNLKFKKSGRALCTLYPDQGWFYAMVSIGRREAEEAEFILPHCSPYLQQLYQSVPPFNGGRWLMIRVDSPEILADAKRLIALRVNKRPAKAAPTA